MNQSGRSWRDEDVERRSWLLFDEVLGGGGRANPLRGIQVADRIERYIWDRRLRPGDPLGSDRELIALFATSRRLVRQAGRTLLARGTVDIQRGKSGGHVVAAVDLARAVSAIVGAASDPSDRLRAAEGLALVGARLATEAGPAATLVRAALSRLADGGGGGAPVAEGQPSLAAATAARIEADLQLWLSTGQGGRSGALEAMCERYDVSLPVIVQSLRLLEDAGVLRLRRGRLGGIQASPDRSARAVRTVHAHLAGAAVTLEECDRLVRVINIALIERASVKAVAPAELEQALGRMRAARDATAVGMHWYGLQRVVSNLGANPPLHLLVRCLAGFLVRVRTRRPDLRDDQARVLVDASEHIVDNILRGRNDGSVGAHHRCQEALKSSW